ncbi:MAG: 4Fe-4S binding protein [Mariprofundales bacterium]|nr:4Fe-4S binding protein [Mariprofundales bacterium]
MTPKPAISAPAEEQVTTPPMVRRRRFVLAALAGVVGCLAALKIMPGTAWAAGRVHRYRMRFLRPPGALAEEDFLGRCIRCGQCAEACPNNCIQYFGLEGGVAAMGTPFIIPRQQACILCMKCGDICPTGALASIPRTVATIIDKVQMGKARVDKHLCLSYQGKTCGVCYRACPLPDISLRVGYLEQPHVLKDCVGCGLCERACIQMPQAIRIIPHLGERSV